MKGTLTLTATAATWEPETAPDPRAPYAVAITEGENTVVVRMNGKVLAQLEAAIGKAREEVARAKGSRR